MKSQHVILILIIICMILIIGIGYLGANKQSPAPITPVVVANASPADSVDQSSEQSADKVSPQQNPQNDKNNTGEDIKLCPHGFDARYCMYDDGSYADGGGRDIDYEPSSFDGEYVTVENTTG